MILKGFRFGLLLQFSIGPVCLFVLETASAGGFRPGLLAMAAAALADACYILLAVTCAALLPDLQRHRRPVTFFGAAVLLLFGLATLLSAFGVSLLPRLSLAGDGGGPFLRCLLLTLSNPLTILFWNGAFSAQAASHGWGKSRIFLFSLGCILSTVVFLTAVAAAGSAAHLFLPGVVLALLNGAVGILLMLFAGKLLLANSRAGS